MPSSLRPPSFDALPSDLKIWLTNANALLKTMPDEPPDLWQHMASHELPIEQKLIIDRYLSDPLQETFNEYHSLEAEGLFDDPFARTEVEKSYVATMTKDLQAACHSGSFESFIACIEMASSYFLRECSIIRMKPVYLAPDANGHYVEYMSYRMIRPTLCTAFHALVDFELPALYRAAVAYVLVSAAHPFRDGNGRLSRTLFNTILINEGMHEDAYISLKKVSRLSRGAMTIHMRRAQMRNQWLPVLAGLSGAVVLTAKMRRLFFERAAEPNLSTKTLMRGPALNEPIKSK